MFLSLVRLRNIGRSGRGEENDDGQPQHAPMSEASTGQAESQLKSPSRVRTNFPETWIWADEIVE